MSYLKISKSHFHGQVKLKSHFHGQVKLKDISCKFNKLNNVNITCLYLSSKQYLFNNHETQIFKYKKLNLGQISIKLKIVSLQN